MNQERLKEQAIEAAIDEINSLDPSALINYATVAKSHSTEQFKISRSTLSRRHRGVTTSHAEYTSNYSRNLTDVQEDELVSVINKYTARGIPPTSKMVQNFAKEICGHKVHKNWVSRFVKRHTNLRSGYLRNIEHARTKAEFILNFMLFFTLVNSLFIYSIFL